MKSMVPEIKTSSRIFVDRSNAMDSLAEVYITKGDMQLAVNNAKKSLQLNADNQNSKNMLIKQSPLIFNYEKSFRAITQPGAKTLWIRCIFFIMLAHP
jgi:hypothetical protein